MINIKFNRELFNKELICNQHLHSSLQNSFAFKTPLAFYDTGVVLTLAFYDTGVVLTLAYYDTGVVLTLAYYDGSCFAINTSLL